MEGAEGSGVDGSGPDSPHRAAPADPHPSAAPPAAPPTPAAPPSASAPWPLTPRRDQSYVALCAGFEVYGMCRAAHEPAAARRASLLKVLSHRTIVHADAAAAASLVELTLSFLGGGGYAGGGYPSLRALGQRALSLSLESAAELAADPAVMVAGGQPALVPLSRRLSKKLGDLLQACRPSRLTDDLGEVDSGRRALLCSSSSWHSTGSRRGTTPPRARG